MHNWNKLVLESSVFEMSGAVRHGVECTNCHTVYLIEHPSNQTRLYYASFTLETNSLDCDRHLSEISDFASRSTLPYINLPNLWKLLCICGQEMRFVKNQLKWYEVSAETVERGHAIQREWKELSESSARLHNQLHDKQSA